MDNSSLQNIAIGRIFEYISSEFKSDDEQSNLILYTNIKKFARPKTEIVDIIANVVRYLNNLDIGYDVTFEELSGLFTEDELELQYAKKKQEPIYDYERRELELEDKSICSYLVGTEIDKLTACLRPSYADCGYCISHMRDYSAQNVYKETPSIKKGTGKYTPLKKYSKVVTSGKKYIDMQNTPEQNIIPDTNDIEYQVQGVTRYITLSPL